jgi:DNA polymerase V
MQRQAPQKAKAPRGADRQQIMSSRSFGTLVYERAELKEAIASYIARAAEKLRAQQSLAGAVQVYLRTNIFKPEVPQYQKAVTLPLPEATADTRVLIQWALIILRRIYRAGYGYHKASVTLLDLHPQTSRQFGLFDGAGGATDARSEKLMRVLDGVNQRYGRGGLRLAAEGMGRAWRIYHQVIQRVGQRCRWCVPCSGDYISAIADGRA